MSKKNNKVTEDDVVADANATQRDQTLTDLLRLLVNHTVHKPMVAADDVKNTNFQIMPDLPQTIEIFNGETGPDHITLDWLNNLKTTAELHKWPDGLRLQMARRHLKSAARDWLLVRLDQLDSWEIFEDAFKRTFTAGTSFAQKYATMQKRIQTKDESVYAYFHSKVRLCQPLGMSFSDVKEHILQGLLSSEMVNTLVVKAHEDTDTLLKDIAAIDRVNSIRNERVTETETTSWRNKTSAVQKRNTFITKAADDRRPNSTFPAQPNTQGTPIRKTVSKDQIHCRNCRTTGHISRDCPQPKKERSKCFTCGWFGKYHTSCTVGKMVSKTGNTL